jgi:hypothetical protein
MNSVRHAAHATVFGRKVDATVLAKLGEVLHQGVVVRSIVRNNLHLFSNLQE